ncbi:MAG: hypothetical protein WC707_05365 [Candidatus Babeliaceae bacterium]|jgi:hypothetical protein
MLSNRVFLKLLVAIFLIMPKEHYAMVGQRNAVLKKTLGFAFGINIGLLSEIVSSLALEHSLVSEDYSKYSTEELKEKQAQFKDQAHAFWVNRDQQIKQGMFSRVIIPPLIGGVCASKCSGFIGPVAVGVLTGAAWYKYIMNGSMYGKNYYISDYVTPRQACETIKKELEKRENNTK